MNIHIGYMPDFRENLREAIQFAKKHFDFLEPTIPLTIPYNKRDSFLVNSIKKELKGFPVVGHTHWEHDIVNSFLENDFSEIFNEIIFFERLNTKYITIHPTISSNLKTEDLVEVNKKAIETIAGYSDKILIENSSHGPFCDIENIKALLGGKVAGLTIDIGHIILNDRSIDDFLKELGFFAKHFHIHGVLEGKDHSIFKREEELLEIIKTISRTKNNFSFSLEIFFKENKEEFSSINERRNIILSYVNRIKKSVA